eukprot:COSAG06_NODE_61282_length_268_cov_0.615385_1_plen_44_part_10
MWRCAPNSDRCEAIQRAMTPERADARALVTADPDGVRGHNAIAW